MLFGSVPGKWRTRKSLEINMDASVNQALSGQRLPTALLTS